MEENTCDVWIMVSRARACQEALNQLQKFCHDWKCVWKTTKGFKIDFFWKKCKAVYKNSDLLVSSSGCCTLSGCLATHNPVMSSFILFLLLYSFRITKVLWWALPGFIHLFCYPKNWASEYIMWIEWEKRNQNSWNL